MLFLKTTEDIKIVPFLDYDKKGFFGERFFSEEQYIPMYKNKIYVSDYLHALFLMVNDVKNNNMMGRINTYLNLDIPPNLNFPIDLSSAKKFIPLAERLNKQDKVRIALLGGFGPAYGDNICGITVLKILEEELLKYFKEVTLDIYHVQSDKFKDFYKRHGRELYQVPIELEEFCKYDYFYDITSISLIPGYFLRSLVDDFLWMFSIDSGTVGSEKKRNQFILEQERLNSVREHLISLGSQRKKLLLHPESVQKCRHLPDDVCVRLLNEIIDKTEYDIYTVSEISFQHERFFDLREISKSFDDFACIISLMDKIVTVDTATYHVSDAFNIPTFVILTNVGIGRISNYPFAKGYVVDESFLEELENIRLNLEKYEKENTFLETNMPLVWSKVEVTKVIDFLLATE